MATSGAVGLIVNPLAGLGGLLAEKGSDLSGIAARAAARGVMPAAIERARIAMTALARNGRATILTGAGEAGADACTVATILETGPPTGLARDTAQLVAAMQGKVDLILFAGGDGTARDVAAANLQGHPILGIPSGVKMHSGVFARTPDRAGQAAAAFLGSPGRCTEMVEILDIDETARRAGRLSAMIFAIARTPVVPGLRQAAKAGGGGDDLVSVDVALARYAGTMTDDTTYVLGPGTTMAALKDRLGGGTLLGVDVAYGARIVARDVDAADLLCAVMGPARIVLTVIGGQGFVLGRGNQQISPAVIRAVGPDRIDVICGRAKLAALDPPELTIDTGDTALNATLAGYLQVITGAGRRQVMRVVA